MAFDAEGRVLGISDVTECDFGIDWTTPMTIVVISSIAMMGSFVATLVTAAVLCWCKSDNQGAPNVYELLAEGGCFRR